MGVWGTEPLDSDRALDWLPAVTQPVEGEIDALLDAFAQRPYDYGDEVRVAAYVVESLRFFSGSFDARVRPRLVAALRSLLDDRDWIATWNDEAGIRASLERQIRAVESPSSTTLIANLFGVDDDPEPVGDTPPLLDLEGDR